MCLAPCFYSPAIVLLFANAKFPFHLIHLCDGCTVYSVDRFVSMIPDSLRARLHGDYPHCVFSSLVIPTPCLTDHTPSDISSTTCSCDCVHGVCKPCGDQSDNSIGCKGVEETTDTGVVTDETRPSIESADISNSSTHSRYVRHS